MSKDFYNVSDDARVILNEVLEKLGSALNDNRVLYLVTIDKGNGVNQTYYEYREQHLQSTIEWAIDYIGGNIDLDGEPDNWGDDHDE